MRVKLAEAGEHILDIFALREEESAVGTVSDDLNPKDDMERPEITHFEAAGKFGLERVKMRAVVAGKSEIVDIEWNNDNSRVLGIDIDALVADATPETQFREGSVDFLV